MNVCIIDYGLIPGIGDPDALLDRFPSLTSWCDSLLANGAGRVTVAQRFTRRAHLQRGGTEFVFCDSVSALHAAVRERKPDIAHVNGLHFPLQIWRLGADVRSLPIVVQDHAAGDPAPRLARPGLSMRRAVWRRGLGTADAFLFTASAQADAWRAAGLIRDDQRVFAVLESSTTMRPLPWTEARGARGLPGDPSVLWVGRLNSNKDPLTILSGFEAAARIAPRAHLTMIYGADELLPAVREKIAVSEVLRNRVTLAGMVPHAAMAAYFSAADVFVLGSHHEGSGFALLEACACGAQPVVSDIPPFRAIAEPVGRFFRAGDVDGCARQLTTALQAAGADRRAAVVRHFDAALSWARVGAAAMAAYAAIVQ